jgi:hypothetical protein
MKRLALAVALGVTLCSTVNAASLRVSPEYSPTGVYSVYFSGGEHNGNFDTIIVDIVPGPGTQFLNTNSGLSAGAPRLPGEPFTYINRYINFDPNEYAGALNWTILGLTPSALVPNGLGFTAGPLGGKINTSSLPNGELFLANLTIPTAAGAYATANVQVVSAGTILQTLAAAFPVPEPATAGLASFALLGLLAIRRR